MKDTSKNINTSGLDIVIELTRFCNFVCPHCIRGERERIRIKKGTIDKIFQKFEHISTLTLSGGEPALAIDLIEYALNSARHHRVDIGNFYITTNGSITTRRFFNALKGWFNFASENEISGIRVSIDKYHEKLEREAKYKFEEFHEQELIYIEESIHLDFSGAPDNSNYLISDGYAADNYCSERELTHGVEFESCDWDDFDYMARGHLYVNAYGEMFSTCDISYDSQRERGEFKIGNLDDNLQKVLNNFLDNNPKLLH